MFTKYLLCFLSAMVPLLEGRYAIAFAYAQNLNIIPAFLTCYIGGMLPIPFVLLFIRYIFKWLKKFKPFEKIIEKIELRAVRKSAKVKKSRLIGLLVFVALPVPGTGAYTGALIADLLDIRFRDAMWTIALGAFIAETITTLMTYGVIENAIKFITSL